MVRRRGARASAAHARRSGPRGEERWWDPEDQTRAEAAAVQRGDLPRRAWRHRPLLNNAEVVDQFADVPGAERLVQAAVGRRLTALDEGVAFSAEDHQLVVSRVEVFASGDHAEHRDTWQSDGPAVMAALYRKRWHERDRPAGWVEGEWPAFEWEVEPRVDWLRVQDHTDRRDESGLFLYEHLHLWVGRALGTITVRHPPSRDAEALGAHLADVMLGRLAPFA